MGSESRFIPIGMARYGTPVHRVDLIQHSSILASGPLTVEDPSGGSRLSGALSEDTQKCRPLPQPSRTRSGWFFCAQDRCRAPVTLRDLPAKRFRHPAGRDIGAP